VLRGFRQVDVFSAEPFLGNPVAVVHATDGDDGAIWVGGGTVTLVSGTVEL